MNSQQATEYLALPSVKALYQAVRRGQIKVYRLGSRLRFREEDLDSALLSNRQLTVDDVFINCS